MSAMENAARCNRCRKETADWIAAGWLAVVGRVWVGRIKQVDSDASTGHFCSWKCFGGVVAEKGVAPAEDINENGKDVPVIVNPASA